MATLPFWKYQGTGNDFILLDNRHCLVAGTEFELFRAMCHRRFGIGADGLILLEAAPPGSGVHFQMRYYNADGREGSMCGNGGRCIVQFARALGLVRHKAVFNAIDGLHHAAVAADETVALQLTQPTTPVQADAGAFVLDTGSPHYVALRQGGVQLADMDAEGRAIRNSAPYAQRGINVSFYEVLSGAGHPKLRMRTYERGVEAETFSCGTGAVAVAWVHVVAGRLRLPVTVQIETIGGALQVAFEGPASAPWLVGPAERVFAGEWPT